MPQALQVIAAVPVSATPPGAANPANSMDSSGNSDQFDTALSAALDRSEPGVTTDSATETTAVDVPPAGDNLAAGGNPLPLALPLPAAVMSPDQIVAVVLEALTAQTGAGTTASTPSDKAADAKSPALPTFAAPGATTTAETAVLRDPQVAPVNVPAALRSAPSVDTAVLRALQATPATSATSATGEPAAAPALLQPIQTELLVREAGGAEHFKQTVMENMARLSSATEAAGANNSPAPFAIAAAPGNAPLNAPAPATASFSVPVSFGQAAWGQAMGQQVVWAVNQQLSSADLHLSPPELGPVSVRIRLDADQASISFAAAHGAVREAIEAALPRLRDMLATQGIALTDANVTSQEQFHQAQRESSNGHQARGRDGEGVEESVAENRPITRTLRLLDMYA